MNTPPTDELDSPHLPSQTSPSPPPSSSSSNDAKPPHVEPPSLHPLDINDISLRGKDASLHEEGTVTPRRAEEDKSTSPSSIWTLSTLFGVVAYFRGLVGRYFSNLFPSTEDFQYGVEWKPLCLIKKMVFGKNGIRGSGPVPEPVSFVVWNTFTSFVGIMLIGSLHHHAFDPLDFKLLVGSYGATAVLLYATPSAELAQPRNLMGGHTLSALVGVTCYKLLYLEWMPQFAAASAVSLSIMVMSLTGTMHPPGGATAIIAVIGSDTIHNQGYLFVPIIALGALIMLLVALALDNLLKARTYPKHWW